MYLFYLNMMLYLYSNLNPHINKTLLLNKDDNKEIIEIRNLLERKNTRILKSRLKGQIITLMLMV